MVELCVCEVCYLNEGYVGIVQWYCIFEGLVEMCEVVGLELLEVDCQDNGSSL